MNENKRGIQKRVITNIETRDKFLGILKEMNPGLFVIKLGAKWCGPCKQLSPILKDWVKAQNGKVELIEIDVDENQELAKSKKIEAIPYLEMYKNGVKTWSSVGLIGKEELDKSLR